MLNTLTTPVIDTVIWDADGVLFNTFDERGKFQWSKDIAKELGMNTAAFAYIFSPAWDDVLRGVRNTRAHIAEALAAAGSSVSVDDYIAYWLGKDCSVNWEIAAHLSPTHACIGTNQDPLRANLIAKLFAPYVRKVFASSAIGFLKREEGYFRFIEQDLNLAPHQLCLIDDTEGNVEAARLFGWTAHHFRGAAPLRTFLTENEILFCGCPRSRF